MVSLNEKERKKQGNPEKKLKRVKLVERVRDSLIEKNINPTVTAIIQEICRLAEKNPEIEKLTFDQVYRLAKIENIKLPEHDVNERQLILEIKRTVATIERPTLRRIVAELNKVEDFPRWNYGNLWHYLKDHKVSFKSLGIVPERNGQQTFLENLIKAAKEIREGTESVQIPLEKLREKVGLKPAAFANRIKRLNEYLKKHGERDLEARLAKLGLFIKRDQRKEKVSQEKPVTVISPSPIISDQKTSDKILEIEIWLEEFEKLEINENTNIEKEEIVLLLRTMFKELKQKATLNETLRALEEKSQKIIQRKSQAIKILQKQTRKKQKQFSRELDLKHFEGSLADKMFELIRERNVELVKAALDRLWRRSMSGGVLNGKDFAAIDAAKKFLRETTSLT